MDSGPRTRWRAFGQATAHELREALGVARYLHLDAEERERLVRRLGEAIDRSLDVPEDLPQRLAEQAASAREAAGFDPVSAAWARTRERARTTAAIGTLTTIPAMLPVLGPALAALGIVADWRLVAEQQRDLVLEIAALFGVLPDDPTEEVRALFLASAGAALVGSQVGAAVTRVASRHAVEIAASQVARRVFTRLLPGAGAAVAGSLNYAATVALGRASIHRFGEQAGIEIRGILPHGVHPAMPRLRQAITDSVVRGSVATLDAESAALAELDQPEREELLDTALSAAASGGGVTPEEEARLYAIGAALGFTADQVGEAYDAFLRELAGTRERLGLLLRRARLLSSRGVSRVWRGARGIATRGWRRVRNNAAETGESEELD
ncbi:MAG: hypothetical protein ACRELD_13410 [Longimicrobiales bacterium]